MTDISKMTDAKLNAAVAEEVMGRSGQEAMCPCYPTEISAAWEVVKAMRQDGWWLKLHHCLDSGKCSFEARFDHQPGRCRGVSVYAAAPTAPRVICEVALKAVRQERKP